MTEEEWLTSSDPRGMLRLLKGKASDRKLRLLACSFARERMSREGGEDATPQWAEAVRVGERLADGEPRGELGDLARFYVCMPSGWRAVEEGSVEYAMGWGRAGWSNENHYRSFLATTFREVFGNPFQPVTFNSEWRTTDVMLLANGIYKEKAFDRMPILADALQDAGCDSDSILEHLRDGEAMHLRGCWALDLVLGKA